MLTVHFQFSIFAHNGKTCFNGTVWYNNKMEIWLDTMFTDHGATPTNNNVFTAIITNHPWKWDFLQIFVDHLQLALKPFYQTTSLCSLVKGSLVLGSFQIALGGVYTAALKPIWSWLSIKC